MEWNIFPVVKSTYLCTKYQIANVWCERRTNKQKYFSFLACRYEKSSWSECSPSGEMIRTDKLKANSDPTCDQSRRITKKCNKNKQSKATKEKGRIFYLFFLYCHTFLYRTQKQIHQRVGIAFAGVVIILL